MAKKDTNKNLWNGLAVTRILLGFVFLWAFFDKLLGLGVSTPAARAWMRGGSPTTGFLKGVEGPFAAFFNGLAGNAVADWLFMLGLFGIGAALLLGIAMRLAASSGVALMLLMWAASLPLENNPLVDDHIVYAAVLVVLAATPVHVMSLQGWWQKQALAKKLPLLR